MKKASQMKSERSYRTGQTAWALGLKDILKTLDSDGKLDGLPFMPEMVRHCGRSFRVAYLPKRACVEEAGIYEFSDVIFLEGLRCDGGAHDGCQRGCILFWKEAWLTNKPPVLPEHDSSDEVAAAKLMTMKDKRYFCQSTELAGAAIARQEENLGFGERLRDDLDDLRVGNIRPAEFSRHMLKTISNRLRHLAGVDGRDAIYGSLQKTPSVSLGLQAGDLVEVKSRKEIEETLDTSGKNKGLWFSPVMLPYCGKRYRVASRLQRIILERTGKMIHFKDTVVLDNVTCQAWGCQRSTLLYWREIWLKRVESDS